jgi:hypothetical protein
VRGSQLIPEYATPPKGEGGVGILLMEFIPLGIAVLAEICGLHAEGFFGGDALSRGLAAFVAMVLSLAGLAALWGIVHVSPAQGSVTARMCVWFIRSVAVALSLLACLLVRLAI